MLLCVHPIRGLHASSVQLDWSSQESGTPGAQAPPEHLSPVVQAFPSSHGTVLLLKTQPDAGSHASSVQTFPSSHASADPGAQAPPEHLSPVVQAFPSSHGTVLLVKTHPDAGSHASSVQTFPSSQMRPSQRLIKRGSPSPGGSPPQAPTMTQSTSTPRFSFETSGDTALLQGELTPVA